MDVLGVFYKLWSESGFSAFFMDGGWKNLIMILIAFVLLYLGIVKKFEPLLLVGIALWLPAVEPVVLRCSRRRQRSVSPGAVGGFPR